MWRFIRSTARRKIAENHIEHFCREHLLTGGVGGTLSKAFARAFACSILGLGNSVDNNGTLGQFGARPRLPLSTLNVITKTWLMQLSCRLNYLTLPRQGFLVTVCESVLGSVLAARAHTP